MITSVCLNNRPLPSHPMSVYTLAALTGLDLFSLNIISMFKTDWHYWSLASFWLLLSVCGWVGQLVSPLVRPKRAGSYTSMFLFGALVSLINRVFQISCHDYHVIYIPTFVSPTGQGIWNTGVCWSTKEKNPWKLWFFGLR